MSKFLEKIMRWVKKKYLFVIQISLLEILILIFNSATIFAAGINIDSGTSLNINSNTLIVPGIVNNSGTLQTTSGKITVASIQDGSDYVGSWVNSGTFTSGTGEVEFKTATSHSDALFTLNSGGVGVGKKFYKLSLSGVNGATLTLQSNAIELDNNLVINPTSEEETVVLDANGQKITVAGNWENHGTYTANSNSVVLDGTGTSVISGANTFYDLSSTTAAKQITFTAGLANETIVTHSLTLQGTSGEGNLLKLRSSASADAYLTLNSGASQSFDYLDVQYNNASRGLVLAAGPRSTDNGDNDAWTFKIISLTLRNVSDGADYTTWNLGAGKDKDTAYIMDADNCVLVKNNGNVNQDFALKVATTNWTIASTTGQNQAVLMGVFNGNSAPLESAFSATNDLLSTSDVWGTVEGDGSGKFQAVSDGVNVAAGSGEKLYMYLKTPVSQTQGAQETITVTVTTKQNGT